MHAAATAATAQAKRKVYKSQAKAAADCEAARQAEAPLKLLRSTAILLFSMLATACMLKVNPPAQYNCNGLRLPNPVLL